MHKMNENEIECFFKILGYAGVSREKTSEILALFDNSLVLATKMFKFLNAHSNRTEEEIYEAAKIIASTQND